MIVETSVIVSGSSAMAMMNERSILSELTGSFARYPSDEYPVPKSSIAMLTPMSRMALSFVTVASMSSMMWMK